jgi:hypothetical protein
MWRIILPAYGRKGFFCGSKALAVALKIVSVLVADCAAAMTVKKRKLTENRIVLIRSFGLLKNKDIELDEKAAWDKEALNFYDGRKLPDAPFSWKFKL